MHSMTAAALGVIAAAALGPGAGPTAASDRLTVAAVFQNGSQGVEAASSRELAAHRGGWFLSPAFFANILSVAGGQNTVAIALDDLSDRRTGAAPLSLSLTAPRQDSTATVSRGSSRTASRSFRR